MSNSCKQTLTLSNTAEIVENESRFKLSPLRWSSNEWPFKRKDVEGYGVLGLSMRTMGFVFGLIAFVQTQKLTKSLKEKVMLEESLAED